jgi:oligoendopeptidase F
MGLLAVHDAQPGGFFSRFDTLLADSGMKHAAELAAPFGINLRSVEFWRTGLQGYREDVDRFEALVGS